MRFFRYIKIAAAAAALLLCLSVVALAASPLSDVTEVSNSALADGVQLTVSTATAGDRPQTVYAITASGGDYAFEIAGAVKGKSLITDAAPCTLSEGEQVVAAVNGDHFSFATGIPLGMAISDGRLLSSPVEPYNADEYFFHSLGITSDGTVLTGENPELDIRCTIGGVDVPIDRINRTREDWEGAQVCLFTPDYGTSTGTNAVGMEYIIRVSEGEVAAGSTLKGVIEAENADNDSALEDGTIVLSAHLLASAAIDTVAVGDSVEIAFSFTDERWNDVQFAVGGNLTIVENGEALPFDYELGVFTAAAPRSAVGVREDGTLVMVAVDGRSDISKGLTANEMAHYMAEDMDCAYAILLDGGGSTALATADESGALRTANIPSEERPVGNTILLVKQAPATDAQQAGTSSQAGVSTQNGDMTVVIIVAVIVAVLVIGGLVLLAVLYKPQKHGENNE